MRLPIAKHMPSLDNPQLEAEVFGPGALPGYDQQIQRRFHEAFHHQRLEWLGDRELNTIAAQICFVLAPIERTNAARDTPSLKWLEDQ